MFHIYSLKNSNNIQYIVAEAASIIVALNKNHFNHKLYDFLHITQHDHCVQLWVLVNCWDVAPEFDDDDNDFLFLQSKWILDLD